ncbi:MAG: class I SAM-dependent methyltransferase [Methylacidiphilales bacterium]|nr:class I SAM-dependent methyltransferase [Candidatus Methylacidiphilales bacterium]
MKNNRIASSLDVCHKGQVFTPAHIVDKMLRLRKRKGTVLEPSCGDGAFFNSISGCRGVEIDAKLISHPNIWHGDFFEYSTANKFDTIIGNPPYVRYQDIPAMTKRKLSLDLFDGRSNLYLFFIEKCMRHLADHGELIFITPREFIKATSAKKLNELLYEQGSITYFEELGDSRVFQGFSPNCAIWRWEKNCSARTVSSGQGHFNYADGQIWFGDISSGLLQDSFTVKVGAVSGANHIYYTDKHGETPMVCSHTRETNKSTQVIYNSKNRYLHRHKQTLMQRLIKNFNENNWWQWGRNCPDSKEQRIYVNCKTRKENPFFMHKVTDYDGSVMALFPKLKNIDLELAVHKLNKVQWDKLGFTCDGRLQFTQRSLARAPIDLESIAA